MPRQKYASLNRCSSNVVWSTSSSTSRKIFAICSIGSLRHSALRTPLHSTRSHHSSLHPGVSELSERLTQRQTQNNIIHYPSSLVASYIVWLTQPAHQLPYSPTTCANNIISAFMAPPVLPECVSLQSRSASDTASSLSINT